MNANKANKTVLNVRLSGFECDQLRAIAEEVAPDNAPVSLAGAVRQIVRDYIQKHGGEANQIRGGHYERNNTPTN